MGNSSQVSYFTLGAYFDTGPLRWLYFLLIMSVYALIVLSNLLLIVVICLNRALHEPMYFFLCSLFINELYGSTAIFPFLLAQILKDSHTVSYSFCFVQILTIYTYGSVEILNLAVMSYDRYLAICYPLQYNTRMTSRRLTALIAVAWLYPFCSNGTGQFLAASLQLCGNVIPKVYCDNYFIVKLSCNDTTLNNIYGLFSLTVTVCFPLALILYTYCRILRVCFHGSKQSRQKAVSTCTPHITSVIHLSFGMFFEIIQSRFDMTNVHSTIRILLSLYFLMVPPLFNPLMYGLKLRKIRRMCRNVLLVSKQGDSENCLRLV